MNFSQLLTNLNPFKKKSVASSTELVEPEVMNDIQIDEKSNEIDKLSKLGNKKLKSGIGEENWKLSETDKQIVVSLHATGLTTSEVIDRARLEHNINISASQVYAYARAEKWKPLIRKIREKTMSDLSDVAGSHKKVRLARGETIYDKAIQRGKLDTALKAVETQRKEMEGDSSVNLTLNQYNVLSDEELQLKQREVMEKIKRITDKKGITLEQPTDKANTTGS